MSIPETPLARISVGDAMHTGILMTDPDTPLTVVARLMAERRVHIVVVAEDGQTRRPLNLISAMDVVGAVAGAFAQDMTAGQAARTQLKAVRADEPVEEAARIMTEHGVEHLVVVDPGSGHAEGIISAIDVAAVLGR